MRAIGAATGRALRAVRLLARDDRIPKPVRWAAVLGLLPVPGPLDEVVMLLVAAALWLFWRDLLVEAWNQADAASLH
ncbi:MAG TPA: hypothetical protein VFR38_11770 [Gaiellaceae bacterium]|nr:hypothetical protein [Gaiellaceae bacterium]